MSDKKTEQRILNYEAHIVALGILRAQKSYLVTKSAMWQPIYQAQLETARLKKKIAEIDQAKRDIIIVAVSGCGACIGSFAVTSLLARSAGVAYKTGSMAAPLVTATTAVAIPTGSTISVTASTSLGLTLKQFIVSQVVQTILIRIPVGWFLARTINSNAMKRFFELVAGHFNKVPYSEEEFRQLCTVLENQSIGNKRFKEVVRNPDARLDQLKSAVKVGLQELVAGKIGDAILSTPAPANGLLLMSQKEHAKWYRKFRQDVDAYVHKKYANWSREDRSILLNTLYWDFWKDVKNQLNSLDRKWYSQIQTLNKAINTAVWNAGVAKHRAKKG